MFTIYGLIDPRDRRVHYVGCTARPLAERLREHRLCESCGPRSEWIEDVLASGQAPGTVVLAELQDAAAAAEAEVFWIAALLGAGAPLTNVAKPPASARSSSNRGLRNRWAAVSGCGELHAFLDRNESIGAAALARKLGVGLNTVYFWRVGFRRPSAEFKTALHRIAGIHPDAWLTASELATARRTRAA